MKYLNSILNKGSFPYSKIIRFVGLSVIILFVTSCSKNELNEVEYSKAVNFSSGQELVVTRTSNFKTEWNNGDEIGITMSGITPLVFNQLYIAKRLDQNGSKAEFNPQEADEPIMFPKEGNVNFVATYPYKPDLIDFNYPVDLTDATDKKFIFSNNAVRKNIDDDLVNLEFESPFCELYLELVKDFDLSNSELKNLSVQIHGVSTKGVVNLETGSVSLLNKGSVLDMEATKLYNRKVLLFPQNKLKGANVQFISENNRTFNIDLSEYQFEAGFQYKYKVYIGEMDLTVEKVSVTPMERLNSRHNEQKPQTYKIGDFYPENTSFENAEGIVYRLDKPVKIKGEWTSDKGQIISLKKIFKSDEKYKLVTVKKAGFSSKVVRSEPSGLKNTHSLIGGLIGKDNFESDYPLFYKIYYDYNSRNNSVINKNLWFLPSLLELRHIYMALENDHFKKNFEPYGFVEGEYLSSSLFSVGNHTLIASAISDLLNLKDNTALEFNYYNDQKSGYVFICRNF